MGADTTVGARYAIELRLSTGKSSSGSGRGGGAFVLFSMGSTVTAVQDLATTELQISGINTGEITLTATGADSQFDIEILNPNSTNSSDWAWTLELEVSISGIDASNRIPNLEFIEAVVEAV